MTSTATDSGATTTTASSTSAAATVSDGMSSTSAASSTSTSTASTTTVATDGATDPTTTTTTGGEECSTPETYECDIWAQDDCCEGEKCIASVNSGGSAWSVARCVPIDPDPDPVGAVCTFVVEDGVELDTCVPGAMCWSVDPETNVGVCVALCEGSDHGCHLDPWSCCPDGFACTIASSGVLILCLEFCDPIAQNCLAEGDVCRPTSDYYWFGCSPDVSGDMGAAGDPCEYIYVCDPGTYCGDPAAYPGCDPNAGGCCIPFCPLDRPECTPGTECMPWYDPVDTPPGYENLGACTIPP